MYDGLAVRRAKAVFVRQRRTASPSYEFHHSLGANGGYLRNPTRNRELVVRNGRDSTRDSIATVALDEELLRRLKPTLRLIFHRLFVKKFIERSRPQIGDSD